MSGSAQDLERVATVLLPATDELRRLVRLVDDLADGRRPCNADSLAELRERTLDVDRRVAHAYELADDGTRDLDAEQAQIAKFIANAVKAE